MRCYFIKDGHIAGARELPDLLDQDVLEQIKTAFEDERGSYDTFEVWEQARVVYQHTPPIPKVQTKQDWMLVGSSRL